MKRFIVTTLSVAVFFFGLGALIEKTAAQFKSDPAALDLIQKARIAIGGDAAIASIESIRIVGRTTQNFDFDGQMRAEAGEMEIALRFPNSMSRTIRIGSGADGAERKAFSFTMLDQPSMDFATGMAAGAGHAKAAKALIHRADGSLESVDPATLEKILAERKVRIAATAGEAKDRSIILSRDGEVITAPEASQIFLRKAEVEAGAAGGHRVIVRTPDGSFKNADGTVIIDSEGQELRAALGSARAAAPLAVTGIRQNEMLRTTLALLLTAPQGTDVTYTYGGESVIEGTACNIVVATSGASSYKIYLSQSTSLPVAMSYTGSSAPRVMFKRDSGTGVGATTYRTAETQSEILVTYSDYRSINGVLLPHRWTQSSGNVVNEIVDVTSYEINPANIGEKFQNPHILIRSKKDGN